MRKVVYFSVGFIVGTIFLSGCSHITPQAGPSTISITGQYSQSDSYITLVNLSTNIVWRQKEKDRFELSQKISKFMADKFSPSIGPGDILDITIYEQSPAVLFAQTTPQLTFTSAGIAVFNVPQQIIDDRGYITVPFVGRLYVSGKKPEEVASLIENLLKSKANKPSVIVRVVDYRSGTVSILGQVKDSRKVALTYNTSTLLDVLSSVGGPTSPVKKSVIKIDRKGQSIELPLELVIKNPDYNINLLPGDIITVIHKNKSATFLGASGKNEEMEFEELGITISQALGRVGGLQDDRAHAKGLFIFRMEDPKFLEEIGIQPKAITDKGTVPVVYNIDMSNPDSFFVIKEFELKDKDIVYVATAPAVQLRKFLQTITDIITPIFQIKILSR